MSRKLIVYISGKITGNENYKADFAEAEHFDRAEATKPPPCRSL